MRVEIRTEPFDAYDEIRRYEAQLGQRGTFGATASFVGTMRDFNDGQSVSRMQLEHYPGMTEQHLQSMCAEAGRRWVVLDGLVLHRVGDIQPGAAIVVVGIWAGHRGDALDACRFIIEDLKSKAPFWKKEDTDAGVRWVANNTSGYQDVKKT